MKIKTRYKQLFEFLISRWKKCREKLNAINEQLLVNLKKLITVNNIKAYKNQCMHK